MLVCGPAAGIVKLESELGQRPDRPGSLFTPTVQHEYGTWQPPDSQ